MKSISALSCTLILVCISCSGQTNGCTSSSIAFSLEPLRLRSEAAPEPLKAKVLAPVAQTPVTPVKVVSLGTGLDDGEFHSRVVRPGEFYLTRAASPPDSPIARFVDDVFRPEVFYFGKVGVSSPIATVIKRKNPLCLLSGLSLMGTETGDGGICFKLLELSW